MDTEAKNIALIKLSASQKIDYAGEGGFLAIQSVEQRVFVAVWTLESEVNNGGFALYFANPSSETAAFIMQALETIGAPNTADICRRAIEVAFPEGLPLSAEDISSSANDRYDELCEQLDSLDQEFFSYPNNLTELLFEFVLRHPEEFGSMGDSQ